VWKTENGICGNLLFLKGISKNQFGLIFRSVLQETFLLRKKRFACFQEIFFLK